MIVVSDTSPITNLAAIGQLELLEKLYTRVLIPTAVYSEMVGVKHLVPGAVEVQTLPLMKRTFELVTSYTQLFCKLRVSNLLTKDLFYFPIL
ncbi:MULTISPECIES: hypothetical protein [Planktothrix]|uniref:Nucleic acid-binding protein n=1 Tax=Planktothrix rubescens CCAP 1459/22 TaxID=329571 RepID=A0A6J7ZND3_PLARU|nr:MULTISPECIES: hypothetical protein [Planktothrix]CAC5345257.1 hypothetical protein PLAN_60272 [Planktothrix rubescens NIVA-CYA 18]CAD0222456.1 conserved hypothetical protein [Planktothrix agardhii]CAD5961776.1 hypothetical protein PCC7821_03208 [Planktothrix rubescens NIVA-CYA 18]